MVTELTSAPVATNSPATYEDGQRPGLEEIPGTKSGSLLCNPLEMKTDQASPMIAALALLEHRPRALAHGLYC